MRRAALVVRRRALLGVLLPAVAGAAPQLYDTGPSQDLALVRFVNAGSNALTVQSGGPAKASVVVQPSAPITDYQPARSDAPVTGHWKSGQQQKAITLRVPSGGSASAVAWQGANGEIAGTSFTEPPPTFDPLRASLAFYNADARCTAAGLSAASGNAAIFENQAALASARRAVNPVKLAVHATCNGQPVDGTVDLGSLQAGQRYSVFLVPAGKGSRLMGLQDRIAR